ncbi:Pentatricopeptide repeat-containing protein [Nymphaea thermarum]|nr:Pentatricopeptide repeat-containing protein [Nymphaea thermarum]
MERLLNSSFLPPFSPPEQHPLPYFFPPLPKSLKPLKPRNDRNSSLFASVPSVSANWTLSDGNSRKNFRRNLRKKPLSDDDARRIIKERARYLSVLRRNQGSQAQASKRIRRTLEQMAQLLKDGRDGHIYGKHVVGANKTVRGLSTRPEGSYDMRQVMSSFITKLTFREMCIVLKEQRGWRQARDFFWWMKLQVGELYEDMKSQGVTPSNYMYASMLSLYQKEGEYTKALAIFSEMARNKMAADEVIYGIMIRIYGKLGLYMEAESTFKEVEQLGLLNEEKTYVAMVQVRLNAANHAFLAIDRDPLWCAGEINKAEKLNFLVVELGERPGDTSIASLISFYGRQHQLRQAKKVFNSVTGSSAVERPVYSSMIDAYARCGNLEEANRFYEEMVAEGLGQDAVTISVMVNTFTNHGMVTSNPLDRKPKLMRVVSCAGKLLLAADIYDRMFSSGVPTSLQTYSTMIRQYLCSSLENKLSEKFSLIPLQVFVPLSADIKVDEKAYTNMITCYGKAGRTSEAFALFNEMKKEGIRPGKISYDTMINAFAVAGVYEQAQQLFQTMQSEGYCPDTFTHLALTRAYLGGKKYLEAEEIIHVMRNKGLRPTCASLLLPIPKLDWLPMLKESMSIYRTVKPDIFILSAAVHLYEHAGMKHEAEDVLEFLNMHGLAFQKSLEGWE